MNETRTTRAGHRTRFFAAVYLLWIASAFAPVCFVLAQTTTLRVPASSFHSDRAALGYGYSTEGYVYGLEDVAFGTTGCLVAPLHLPNGAEITALRAHLWNNAPQDFGVALYRKRIGAGTAAEQLARATTNVTAAAIFQYSDVSVSFPVVDSLYSYFLATASCPDGSGQRIYAVDVEFTPNTSAIFADGFESGSTSAWSGGSRDGDEGRGSSIQTLRLSGMHFLPDVQGFRSWRTDVAEGSFTMAMDNHSDPGGVLCMALAPVLLPDGAEVVGMISYLWDASTTHQAMVRLKRSSFTTTAAPQEVLRASTSVPNAPAQWQLASDFSVAFGTVDNASFWFYVEFCQGGSTVGVAEQSLRVQAVDVLYTVP